MPRPTPRKRRWRVEVDRGEWISVCGPDYESETEFRVVDASTGEVVLTFTETGDWPFMVSPSYYGTASVELAPDGSHVVVTDHDGKVRLEPLPG